MLLFVKFKYMTGEGAPKRWLHPHQERAVQRRQVAEMVQLPIREQAERLKSDAEVLAGVLEFGLQVRELLNQFGNADAIPETLLREVVEGFDYPPGMALALARVLESQTGEKSKWVH